MVYAEQVRQLASEENLINDPSTRSSGNSTWGTLRNYGNITLNEDTLIVWYVNCTLQSCYRLKVGSYYIRGWYDIGSYSGIAAIPAGTHAVILEQKNLGGSTGSVNGFQLGTAKFSDYYKSNLNVYSSTINLTVSQRSNPSFFGTLKKAVFGVIVWAYTPGGQTNFENVGDALTNGVSLSVDGAQVNWTNRIQDIGSNETASAYYYCSLSVGSSHSFAITKDNANTVVHISLIGCPWLLASVDNEPISFSFAQGSTLYVTLEPLNDNPTKNSKMGKVRSVSFGSSTDFYSTASGTGILSHSYTFEIVAVTDVSLFVNGLGGCISLIGLDVR